MTCLDWCSAQDLTNNKYKRISRIPKIKNHTKTYLFYRTNDCMKKRDENNIVGCRQNRLNVVLMSEHFNKRMANIQYLSIRCVFQTNKIINPQQVDGVWIQSNKFMFSSRVQNKKSTNIYLFKTKIKWNNITVGILFSSI